MEIYISEFEKSDAFSISKPHTPQYFPNFNLKILYKKEK